MDVRDLYGLPLERFVAERTALARALRAEGRREEAARVAELPKPSVAAWAVNQMVRTQARAIAALFEAGDALQQAQGDVLAGRGSPTALREASEAERGAVDALVGVARGLLSSQGQSLTPATLERVAETLRAAALDPEARNQVQDGCLVRELRHVGLGEGGLGGGLIAPPAPRRVSPERANLEAHKREAEEARRRAVQEARQRAAEEARDRETEAREEAAQAARTLELARERREAAAEALREAEEALRQARDRAEQAASRHRRAQRAVEEASALASRPTPD
jgi:hypothetical protein